MKKRLLYLFFGLSSLALVLFFSFRTKSVVIGLEQPDSREECDRYREAIAHLYPNFGNLCEEADLATLRSLKMAGDLKARFGDLRELHIVEIGGGDGRQCQTLSDLAGFASYTIIDHLENQQAYEELENVHFLDIENFSNDKTYDLVISHLPFLHLPEETQNLLMTEVMQGTPCGYIYLDDITYSLREPPLKVASITRALYQSGWKGKIGREDPSIDRYVLQWSSPEHEEREACSIGEHALPPGCAITHPLSGGQMGDSLTAYFHARWIAYKYQIPIKLSPFRFCDFFHLDDDATAVYEERHHFTHE